jgi:large subunit ribosomal protein L22
MAETEEKKVTETAAKTTAKKTSSPKAKKAPAAKKADTPADVKEAPKADKAGKGTKAPEAKNLRKEAYAELNNYGATPRKVRLVVDLVRGKDIDEAYAILDNCSKLCAKDVKKVIMSAVANAVNNFKMDPDTLYVATISANDAMKLKRILPRAKGSASSLIKRWSHIYVTVKNREAK